MKEITRIYYQCEICGYEHWTKDAALECETRPITWDKGAKIGDIVKITRGEGSGQMARVCGRHIIRPDYHPKFAHTVALTADLVDGWGTRDLTFDSYETCNN